MSSVVRLNVLLERNGLIANFGKISFNDEDRKALLDSVVALEKLEKLKEWLIKSEDDFQLLRISVTGDKLKCWYLDGQFKILEEVRLLL